MQREVNHKLVSQKDLYLLQEQARVTNKITANDSPAKSLVVLQQTYQEGKISIIDLLPLYSCISLLSKLIPLGFRNHNLALQIFSINCYLLHISLGSQNLIDLIVYLFSSIFCGQKFGNMDIVKITNKKQKQVLSKKLIKDQDAAIYGLSRTTKPGELAAGTQLGLFIITTDLKSIKVKSIHLKMLAISCISFMRHQLFLVGDSIHNQSSRKQLSFAAFSFFNIITP